MGVLGAAAVLVALAAPVPAAAVGPKRIEPATGYVLAQSDLVSPGVQVERWSTAPGPAPVQAHVARLAPEVVRDRLRLVLSNEEVFETSGPRRETTSSMCVRTRCVVGVNADYWITDGIEAGAPVGPVVVEGEAVRSPAPVGAVPGLAAALLTPGGPLEAVDATAGEVPLRLSLRIGDEVVELDGLNRRVDGITAWTSRWGDATPEGSAAVELVFGIGGGGPLLVGVHPLDLLERRTGGATRLEPGQVVVRACCEGADRLQALLAGDDGAAVSLEVDTGGHRTIVGGSPQLLEAERDGPQAAATATDAPPPLLEGPHPVASGEPVGAATEPRAPRTMVGWDLAGDVVLVTADGRQPGWSAGLTLLEGAQLLRAMGAVEGINLDGGGSTTFVVGGRLRNRPSDGAERAVVNALVVVPPEGTDFRVPVARGTDLACPTGRTPALPFLDVPESDVHRASVACVAGWGVASGRTERSFDPVGTTSRGQMASFIARVLRASGVALPAAPPDAFADDGGSVHAPSIDALAALGVVGGRADGSYGPDALVTRGQMAAFLTRAYGVRAGGVPPAQHDYFADDSLDPFEPAINAAAGLGLTGGTADGRYASTAPVRRHQMASFLARLLDHLVANGQATPPF